MTRRDDSEPIAIAAGVYFRAAANLAEASLLARLASRHVDDDDLLLDSEEFHRLVGPTADALEMAAAEHERAVDLISKTVWGSHPDMAEHLDFIRTAVRALNLEAVRLAGWLTDDHQTAGSDDADAERDGEPTIRFMLLDRADLFREKAWLMAESARVLMDGAHTLAEGPR